MRDGRPTHRVSLAVVEGGYLCRRVLATLLPLLGAGTVEGAVVVPTGPSWEGARPCLSLRVQLLRASRGTQTEFAHRARDAPNYATSVHPDEMTPVCHKFGLLSGTKMCKLATAPQDLEVAFECLQRGFRL